MTRLRTIAGLALIAGTMCIGVAYAADGKVASWRYNMHDRELPFPRSERWITSSRVPVSTLAFLEAAIIADLNS